MRSRRVASSLSAVLVAVALFASSSVARSNAPYFSIVRVEVPGDYPGLSGAKALDIDHDGDLDVLTLPLGDNTSDQDEGEEARPTRLRAFRNDGDGKFTEAKSLIRKKIEIMSVPGRNAIVGDFNGDGLEDVYFGDSGPDNATNPGATNGLALGTRSGQLRAAKPKDYPIYPEWTHGVAVGDADGDGDLDVFEANIGVCCTEEDLLGSGLFLNDGRGSFREANDRLPGQFETQNAEFIDYDRDGDNDLFVSTTYQPPGFPSGRAHLLINDGAGSFLSIAQDQPIDEPRPDQNAINVEQGDINGDGWPDMVFGSTTDAAELPVQVLLNDRKGGFRDAGSLLPGGMLYGDFVRLADLNNDGWPDLLASNDRLRVFINRQGRSFVEAEDIFGGADAERPGGDATPADVDGDGDLDLIITASDRHFYYAENLSPFDRQKRLKKPGRAKKLRASAVDGGHELAWKHARRAVSYSVEISETEDFSNVLFSTESYTGSAIAIDGLEAGKEYFWRVRGANLSGSGKWTAASLLISESTGS